MVDGELVHALQEVLAGMDCGSQQLEDDLEPVDLQLDSHEVDRGSFVDTVACDDHRDTAGIPADTVECDRRVRKLLLGDLEDSRDKLHAVVNAVQRLPCLGGEVRRHWMGQLEILGYVGSGHGHLLSG